MRLRTLFIGFISTLLSLSAIGGWDFDDLGSEEEEAGQNKQQDAYEGKSFCYKGKRDDSWLFYVTNGNGYKIHCKKKSQVELIIKSLGIQESTRGAFPRNYAEILESKDLVSRYGEARMPLLCPYDKLENPIKRYSFYDSNGSLRFFVRLYSKYNSDRQYFPPFLYEVLCPRLFGALGGEGSRVINLDPRESLPHINIKTISCNQDPQNGELIYKSSNITHDLTLNKGSGVMKLYFSSPYMKVLLAGVKVEAEIIVKDSEKKEGDNVVRRVTVKEEIDRVFVFPESDQRCDIPNVIDFSSYLEKYRRRYKDEENLSLSLGKENVQISIVDIREAKDHVLFTVPLSLPVSEKEISDIEKKYLKTLISKGDLLAKYLLAYKYLKEQKDYKYEQVLDYLNEVVKYSKDPALVAHGNIMLAKMYAEGLYVEKDLRKKTKIFLGKLKPGNVKSGEMKYFVADLYYSLYMASVGFQDRDQFLDESIAWYEFAAKVTSTKAVSLRRLLLIFEKRKRDLKRAYQYAKALKVLNPEKYKDDFLRIESQYIVKFNQYKELLNPENESSVIDYLDKMKTDIYYKQFSLYYLEREEYDKAKTWIEKVQDKNPEVRKISGKINLGLIKAKKK